MTLHAGNVLRMMINNCIDLVEVKVIFATDKYVDMNNTLYEIIGLSPSDDCFFPLLTQAQKSNPYQSIGKKAKVVTLSGGRYQETFDDDTLQRVGTVVINRRTKKIVKLLDADNIIDEILDNSTASRWYSIDPLAEKYPSHSPYIFCANNPIMYIDPDGREVKNGMQAELDQNKANVATAQDNFNKTNQNPNASKKDLRQANRELNRANKLLSQTQSLYDKAQSSIDLVKKVDPQYFNTINTLKDKGGNDVNVYVTAANNFGTQLDGMVKKGETTLIFNTLNGQPYQEKDLNGNPYVKFYTTPQANEIGFTITLFSSSSKSTIANEFGNVEYSTQNSVLDATDYVNQVPYSQKKSEQYSFQVQKNFEEKMEANGQ